MAIKLSRAAFEHAQQLIKAGHLVLDNRGDWGRHQPTTAEENEFIQEHGYGEYSHWHLAINDEMTQNKKSRYEFPYGDFRDVHRCALLAAESRAGQYGHREVELAAAHLLGMLDAER